MILGNIYKEDKWILVIKKIISLLDKMDGSLKTPSLPAPAAAFLVCKQMLANIFIH